MPGEHGLMVGSPPWRTFLVECYTPGVEPADVKEAGVRAAAAAAEIQHEGGRVSYLNAMLMASDEVVFHVFTGPDEDAVRQAAVRACLPFERVVESVAVAADTPATAVPRIGDT